MDNKPDTNNLNKLLQQQETKPTNKQTNQIEFPSLKLIKCNGNGNRIKI